MENNYNACIPASHTATVAQWRGLQYFNAKVRGSNPSASHLYFGYRMKPKSNPTIKISSVAVAVIALRQAIMIWLLSERYRRVQRFKST